MYTQCFVVHPLNFDLRCYIYLVSSSNSIQCTCSMNCSGEIACTSTQCFVVHTLKFDLRSNIYSMSSSNSIQCTCEHELFW